MPIHHHVEQNSPEWQALRAGLPTASEFKRILTNTGKVSSSSRDYACELAAEKLAGHAVNAWGGNLWTERGHGLESEARDWYAFETGLDVQPGDFWTDDEGRWGCSPDGLVGDDGGIEIKSLKAANVISAWLDWQDSQKPPTDYLAQIQGNLFVTGRKWWDLVIYHPALPAANSIIRIGPDPEYHAKLESGLLETVRLRDEIISRLKGENECF